MKPIYKTTKVIFDAHLKEYQVYYKNWFIWIFDSCYKYDERDEKGYISRAVHYCDKTTACQRAIDRAQAMLDTVEVWKKSNLSYYV
jgi:hypothetical protein